MGHSCFESQKRARTELRIQEAALAHFGVWHILNRLLGMARVLLKVQKREVKSYILLPAKIILWAAQGELRSKLRLAREYRLVAASGLFDGGFYRQQYGEVLAGVDPLRHYLTAGAHAGGNPNPLFDSQWYLERNPDVARTGLNPLVHFVRSGWRERRNPHPLFDITYYLARNPDVLESGVNPLLHYLRTGAGEGRDPHVLFQNKRYLDQNPDVAGHGANPLVHYIERGWQEGRDPHVLFSNNYYLNTNPEVAEAEINPLLHFVTAGFRENKNPNALFDCAYYLDCQPDVSASGANPLVHYILSGAPELRSPHPLFDPGYYRHQSPESLAESSNLLAHYFDFGKNHALSPHLLFDVEFYLKQHPALSLAHSDPVQHYLEQGARLGSNPCELFDSSFYLEHYPEVARAGKNPLVHYLTEGVEARHNPNPLFDTAYYLKQYPDVALCGQNPLAHYLEAGAREGRAPSPFFDSKFYLRKNPKLRETQTNPLADYLVGGGAEEGRDPSPFFSTSNYVREHPEVAAQGINPLVHFLGLHTPAKRERAKAVIPAASPKVMLRVRSVGLKTSERESGQADPATQNRPTVLCVSHISPHAPRAGNEIRVARLLRWLTARNYRVIPIISPLGEEVIPEPALRELGAEFDGAVLCARNGNVLTCLDERDSALLARENGSIVPAYADRLGENSPHDARELEVLEIDRSFCHDPLAHVVTKLAANRERYVVIVEYVFMARLLPLLDSNCLKVIDTHDVFSSKRDKVIAYGMPDGLSLTELEERNRLSRADLILAIQPEEQETLERLENLSSKIITVGVDFPVTGEHQAPHSRQVFCVGSDNPMNVRGLRDFLRFAWPGILKMVPDAELVIAGRLCTSVRSNHARVRLLGEVDNADDLYAQCKVTINPALAGTGLKIKTLEALSFLRPIVTWPTGVEGLSPKLASLCSIATDWFEFQQNVANILVDPREQWFSEESLETIRNELRPSTVYAAFDEALSAFCELPGLVTA